MSKTDELSSQIKQLKECGEMLVRIAESLSQLFSAEEVKQSHSFEEVRAILANKSREGHTAEIKALLTEFGVERLSDVDPEKYEELLQKVEAI